MQSIKLIKDLIKCLEVWKKEERTHEFFHLPSRYVNALKNHCMLSLTLENGNVVILETSIEEDYKTKNKFKVRHWSKEDRESIKKLRDRGWTETKIGELFNKSRSAIYYAMRKKEE